MIHDQGHANQIDLEVVNPLVSEPQQSTSMKRHGPDHGAGLALCRST